MLEKTTTPCYRSAPTAMVAHLAVLGGPDIAGQTIVAVRQQLRDQRRVT